MGQIKRFFIIKIFLMVGISSFFLPPLLTAQTGAADGRLTVYTVNYPLKYFAERIGGKRVTVVFPAPNDVDPAYWRPEPATILDYQKADLILLNGANYAKWTAKASLPPSRTVDTSAKIRDQFITSAETTTHSHGPKGEHAHENLAFTTWLDFSQAAEQAKAVASALSRKRPQWKSTFRQNFAALEKDLMALDGRMKKTVAQKPKLPLLVSHPVYDYLARAYALNLRSLHWEPQEVPTMPQMAELTGLIKQHPARWMIWEGTPKEESVVGLQTLGISSLVFNPCASIPAQGDFLKVMEKNIDNLSEAYK